MPADLLRPRTPPATEGQSDSLDARLLQDRLALLGRIAFLIAAAFYAVSLTLVWLGRERAPSPAGHAAILAMLVETGGTWLYCRRGSRSGGMLRALDAASMLVLGLLAVVGPVGAVPEPEVGGLVALLAVNLIVYSRSIFVPSSARRTLAVSAACALPLVAYSLAADDLRFAVWKLAWLAATVSVAAAGSAVIYGLRRQVRHARQLGQYTLE